MSTEKSYQEQLRELYETYAGKELEAVLGVTVRSIQNYLKNDNPTIPSREVISKIRESFAKHKEGKELNAPVEVNNPGPMSQDYREKFYQLLDKNSKLEEKIDKIESNLNHIPGSMEKLTELILEGQQSRISELYVLLSKDLSVLTEKIAAISSSGSHKKPIRKEKH
jgi:transcriptional regulator with XRE-family HTH domain